MNSESDDVGMNFEQALQALMSGHQVRRGDQPSIFVATVNDPLRFYQLHNTEAGPWWPNDDDINAVNYYLVEPRLHYKTAATSLGIVNAMKHLREGAVISRPDHPDGVRVRNHLGVLYAARDGDAWARYQLTPQDMAATSWAVLTTSPKAFVPAELEGAAHG